VVSNFENIGCFYAIERMRGMRVGETMLGSLNFVNDHVYSKLVFVMTLAENFASFIE
jgi:hypothetical protein